MKRLALCLLALIAFAAHAGPAYNPIGPNDTVLVNQNGINVLYPASLFAGGSSGVSSFNTRTGAVTLTLTDVTNVGGAPTVSPTFTTSLNLGASTPFTLNGSAGTSGQVLTSAGTGALPTWQTVTGTGTVTSIAVSGGSTGLTTSGGPVTGSGTITIAGTLGLGYGGTGATTQAGALSAVLGSSAIPIANGGTNSTTASAALTALGAASSGANSSITSLSGLTTPLSLAQGGTNATSAGAALTSLGAASSGANSSITSLSGLTTALSIAQGGTGQTTKAAAFNALTPITTTGDIEYGSAANTASRLAIGSTGQVLTVAGGLPTWAAAGGGSSVVNGFINGFTLSNDGTTPNSVLDEAAGYASDSANAVMITGTAFKKSTAGTWAAGSGSNGMGTGLTIAASTWYHVFAIVNAGSYDVYFDTSATAANAPASTTAHRYIGSFLTNASSQIQGFTEYGQMFIWTTPFLDLNTTTGVGGANVTVSTPLGFVTYPIFLLDYSSATLGAFFELIDISTTYPLCAMYTTVVSQFSYQQCQMRTNTSSQVRYELTGTSPTAQINTNGYINPHVAPNF